MAKKIGLIDLFIDEWHSNHYPAWFAQASRGKDFEVAYAWEMRPQAGKRPLPQWCADMGIAAASSMEEVVDKSDCVCVLAPANPEVHEELAEYALASGKPVYIDKPFAPSSEAAKRLFSRAEAYNTPLMSSSALRFGQELISGKLQAAKPDILTTTGGGRSYQEYGIHQLEMIVSIMGTEINNILVSGNAQNAFVLLEYSGGRRAGLAYSMPYPFSLTASNGREAFLYQEIQNHFENLTSAILDFFATGISSVPKAETLAIAELLEGTVAMLESK